MSLFVAASHLGHKRKTSPGMFAILALSAKDYNELVRLEPLTGGARSECSAGPFRRSAPAWP